MAINLDAGIKYLCTTQGRELLPDLLAVVGQADVILSTVPPDRGALLAERADSISRELGWPPLDGYQRVTTAQKV